MNNIKSVDDLIKELKIVNKWVIIYDNQIVSHNENQSEALRMAREIYPSKEYPGKIFDIKYAYGQPSTKSKFPFMFTKKKI